MMIFLDPVHMCQSEKGRGQLGDVFGILAQAACTNNDMQFIQMEKKYKQKV